jgi:deaminated glutathione amidase
MRPMIAAVLQMNSGPGRRANLAQAEGLLRAARAAGAGMAVLPEHFGCLRPEGTPWDAPEPLQGPTVAWLAGLARDLGLWIVGGSFAQASARPGLVRNTCPVFDPTGRLVAHYQKIHLFDLALPGQRALRESVTALPGRRLALVDTPQGRLGLSICYDLRFPELYRRLRLKGATVLAAPSAFTKVTGQAHWEILVRAWAVENQCYMLAAAQEGAHGGGRESFGRAMIVDPWGEVLAECPPGPGLACAEVDPKAVAKVRRLLDSTSHARLLPAAWKADAA